MSVLIVLLTTILLILSAFIVMVILMQKPSANAGMGSALGGGAAEQAFGGEAANVLTRTTVFGVIIFFVISFGLYLMNLHVADIQPSAGDASELRSLASGLAVQEAVETEVADPVVPESVVDESEAAVFDDVESGVEDSAEETTPQE